MQVMSEEKGKLWTDPIVQEVRKARDEYAKQFNYDVRAMVKDLKEKEKEGASNGRKYGTPQTEDATKTGTH